MSTVIESEAAFNQRCAEASKDATLHTKLVAQGIRCFKTLAFAIGSPQQPPTEAQFDEFSVKVYGAAPTMGQTAILRHLHFEATTLVVQTYRDMVTHDPSDPSHTRKVPVPEKRARLEFQRRRLSGMEISGELEPSHQLLDLANQQYESGVLTWIPASKCAKREAEVLALGKDRSSLLQVEQNVIKVGPGDRAIACDVSDPLRFQWAMMRRGIAFDNCHLLSWDVHQRWVQKMLDCLSATPPPSYSPVSLNQCMRADKELFLLLAREAAPPFKVDSLGVSPLDAKFSAMMYDVRLQQFLLPLPKQTAPVLAVPVDDGAESCSLKTEKCKGGLKCVRGLHICAKCHRPGHSAVSCKAKAQDEDCTVGAAAAGEQTKPLVYRALEQVRGPAEGSILNDKTLLQEKLQALKARALASMKSQVEPRKSPCEGLAQISPKPSGQLEVPMAVSPDTPKFGSSPRPNRPQFTDPEALAKFLLRQPSCLTASAALDLLELLPQEAQNPPRAFQGSGGARFSMGVYRRGGILGLHRTMDMFPFSIKVFNLLVSRVCPAFSYSSLAVHENLASGLHRDENNRDGPTLLVPLTDFENGELWFQKVGGDVASLNDPSLEGCLLDVAAGPTFFSKPKDFHETRPWKGRRVVMLAYSVRQCEELRPELRAVAERLGFSVSPLGLGPFVVSWDPRCLSPVRPSQRDASSVRQSAAGMYFVELCAGTAVLSKAAAKLGFRPFAVDSSRKRAGEQAVIMDLSDPAQAEAVVDFLRVEYHHVICVFISPPVGTASFMRERRKPGSVELDLKMPNALRSALHPDGLPTLRGRDKLQVERANQLFDQLANIACEACDLGILTVLESPSNSRYWDTSFCAQVTNHVQGHFVKFHACVHGGHRPKLMQLWSSQDVFGMLAGRCDGSHEHKPWRPFISKRKRVSFITADEPEFPPLLVDRILGCIVHAHPSLSFGPRVLAQAIQDPSANVARINLGTQPRGNSLPSLVWEFDTTLDFVVPVQCDKPLEAVLSSLPKGSRIFSRRVCEWGSLKSLLEGVGKPKTNIVGLDPLHPPACAELVQVGVPCSEEVFVARAIAAGHPRSLAVHVEPFVTVSARANFEAPPAELASFRIDAMKFWIGRAGALKEKEQELHQNLPDHLRPILKGKKLLLLQEMMRAAGCEDVDLVSDICQGFKLSGWLPASGEFVQRSRRPKFSVETLGVLSKGLNKATLQKLSRRQDSEIEESTWVETQKEIDSGWVWLEEGPVPEMVSIAMRFGIMQNKLRVIDDLSCCGLNATVGLLEKFCLHTIDKLAAMMAHAFDVVSGVMPECCGRTFDLTAAYKQFGVCAADRERLRIAVNRPGHHKPSFLGVNALPFGGDKYRLVEDRIVLFRLFWSAFFDDYSIVSAKSLESNAQWTVETLFDLLGFRFAKDGSKAEPFGVNFNMLGLSVDLSCVKQRILRVGHTQKRKEELTEYIQTILQEGKIDSKAAERLRGRMVFFEGFTFGRVSNRAQRVVAKCVEKFAPQNLTEDLMWALTWLRERIALSQPLVVERNLITTLIVFTDGACNPEEGTGGVGGVLVNASGTPCEFFGEAVPSDMMQQLLSISANPIFELELIPALISLVIWAERLKGAQVVFYLDNDGARHSLIRTFGGGSLANAVIESFLQLETTLQLKTWFARVPTACNIADNPSRLEFEPLLKRGAARRAIPWDQVMP
ncbi:NaCP60E [Symbiodinium sp. CCMP2592]|nr:NaCP60E [Symbiodinium sp. CCMP2592]